MGYRGWRWCVVLAGAPGSEEITVSEIALLPGTDSLLARPGAVERAGRRGRSHPGDVLAAEPDDPGWCRVKSIPGMSSAPRASRPIRTMSRRPSASWVWAAVGCSAGRAVTTQRSAGTRRVQADGRDGAGGQSSCCSCGFYVPLSGALRAGFGVCANDYSADGGGLRRVRLRRAFGHPRAARHPGRPRSRPMTTVRWRSCPPRRARPPSSRPRSASPQSERAIRPIRSGRVPIRSVPRGCVRRSASRGRCRQPGYSRTVPPESDLVSVGYRDRLFTELAANGADAAAAAGYRAPSRSG